MSDGSGVGAVTTPPPSKRGRKTGAYADAAEEEDEDSINSSGNNKPNKRDGGRAKGVSQTNGSALPASRKKEVDSKDQNEKGTSGDDDDVDEDEDDEDGDEYEVQQIIDHMLDVIRYLYPLMIILQLTLSWVATTRENASEILSEYITKIGGRPKLFEKPSKGKKRGRQPASASPTTASKRPKKSEDHPADRESPAEVQKVFKPPAGSWEDEVVDVEMFRGDDGELRVFLTWRNGSKSQHAAQHAYILRFYESRISFKTPTE
ncbi:chromo domain containing protein [Sporothrix brasiliensis 5110]|uniref:Chromo domain containing protein n=1 Tax=Sporothrix brasiliensis 5110 TaxID=1398154 RepID=A0A0C2IQI0_9PEZI|nr:chromo domain containing protein [Sporothrix brasiliensis 5110]KIH89135.1 chromo domain containing protein [Sporothrix brasiliensis 5110]